jgi:cytochrome P450
MIKVRRGEMAKPDFQSKGDFLTILLENEFFNDKDSMIIDECAVFMVAAT